MRTRSALERSTLLHAKNAVRLQAEKRLVRQQADVVLSLRTRAAETGSLASSHQQETDLSLGDGIEGGRVALLLLLRSHPLGIGNLA